MFSKLAAAYAEQKYYHIRAGAPRITSDSGTKATATAVAAVITSDAVNDDNNLLIGSAEAPIEHDTSYEYSVPVKFYTADVDSIPGLIATESQHPFANSAPRYV
jgi:hypothetical protein